MRLPPLSTLVMLLLALVCTVVCAQVTAPVRFPETTLMSLDDQPMVLPRDLPAPATLVLIAFERDQRSTLDTWIRGMGLAAARMPWVEVVVVGPQNAFVHTMIVRGMRREAEGAARRSPLPVFSDQEAFAAALGVSARTAHAFVVDRKGRVMAGVDGAYSASKAQILMSSLAP